MTPQVPDCSVHVSMYVPTRSVFLHAVGAGGPLECALEQARKHTDASVMATVLITFTPEARGAPASDASTGELP